MKPIEESTVIRAPQSAVFAAASDPERQLEWDAGTLKSVQALTPGPLGKGSRYRGQFKGFGTVEYEFAAFEPDRTFAHEARMPLGTMRHTFTLEPTSEGTRLTQLGALAPNALGRLAAPLASRMLRKRFRLIAAELDGYLTK
jgi:hypothetical protein